MNGRDEDAWADDEDLCEEDEIALEALVAILEVEGDDEIAEAARDAYAAIGDAALAEKERRLAREREAAEKADQHGMARRAAWASAQAARTRLTVPPAATVPPRFAALPAPTQVQSRPPAVAPPGRREPRPGLLAPAVTWPPVVAAPVPRSVRPSAPTSVPQRLAPAHAPPPRPAPVATHRVEPQPRPRQTTPAPSKRAPLPTPVEATRRSVVPSAPARPGVPPVRSSPPQAPEPRAVPPLTGADLLAWRLRLGLNQQAAAARLGVGQGTISKGEAKGDALLGPAVRAVLVAALKRDAEASSRGIFQEYT